MALSLGRIQGTAVIGRPVQFSLPVTLHGDEELNCVRAELQQPEQPPVPLAWRAERTGRNIVLRLSSSHAVQEPVIVVRVVVGCHNQFSQSYELLADPPLQREVLPLVATPPPVALVPEAEPVPAARPVIRPAPGARSSSVPVAPVSSAARRTAKAASRQATRAADSRPRAQLELLPIDIDVVPALTASTQLTLSTGSAMTRAEATAWQEISAPPEQRLALARLQSQAVEAELRALREQTRRQAEQLQELVEQRKLERDVVTGIASAIAIGLSLLLWRRLRQGAGERPWYQRSLPQRPATPASDDSSFVDSSFPAQPKEFPRVAPEPDSGWAVPAHAGAAALHGSDIDYTRSRMLPTAEELLDVQDQANFFLAIEQPEKAIELLESRLAAHLGGSPFVWLDLLDLCRKLQRREDYERVRKEFQRTFAARLPRFEEAQTHSGGLERYSKALSRIELLWPSKRVMQEIEKSLFEERAPGAIMFDLEASRDLLLLYSIAMEFTSEQDGQPGTPTGMTSLERAPAESSSPNTRPMPLMELDTCPPPSAPMIKLGLDVDLDALERWGMRRESEPGAMLPSSAANEAIGVLDLSAAQARAK